MKKLFEFWVPLLGPAFLFAMTGMMFRLLYAEIAIFTIVAGSIGFIAAQMAFYKLLRNNIPDIIMRTSVPMDYVAALSGLYLSGMLSFIEICFSLIILGIAVIFGLMFVVRGIKQ